MEVYSLTKTRRQSVFQAFSVMREAARVVLGHWRISREYLSTGYGLRFSTEIYGSKREKTVFHEYLHEY